MVTSASISSLTFIVPISAAKAEPERPARMIAVISGPSSRSTASATAFATQISAPKSRKATAVWKARITPIKKPISTTIGTASAPTRCAITKASRQRMRCGLESASTTPAADSPTKAMRS